MSKYTSFPEPMDDPNPFQVGFQNRKLLLVCDAVACEGVFDGRKSVSLCKSRRVVDHVTCVGSSVPNLRPLVALINKGHINKNR